MGPWFKEVVVLHVLVCWLPLRGRWSRRDSGASLWTPAGDPQLAPDRSEVRLAGDGDGGRGGGPVTFDGDLGGAGFTAADGAGDRVDPGHSWVAG
jgi:hypothetical protein